MLSTCNLEWLFSMQQHRWHKGELAATAMTSFKTDHWVAKELHRPELVSLQQQRSTDCSKYNEGSRRALRIRTDYTLNRKDVGCGPGGLKLDTSGGAAALVDAPVKADEITQDRSMSATRRPGRPQRREPTQDQQEWRVRQTSASSSLPAASVQESEIAIRANPRTGVVTNSRSSTSRGPTMHQLVQDFKHSAIGPPKLLETSGYPFEYKRYNTSMDPRGYLPVYEYVAEDKLFMIDAENSYVHFTGIWRAVSNTKNEIVRLVEIYPELDAVVRKIRGGTLKIQGSWVPYSGCQNRFPDEEILFRIASI
ncbi:hypothetical protein K437DRAFT_133270 [Tilletiaria anomala UBC 951]|uniref:HTH APSES-type domain-containing protein n=1 Tax=Tilletiaria anomala (strain ATCC 24038 / CBS 436.72 / UBC 951) TaxID=1037660 RepID=A0A066WK61_TILAU|nr:uncharacterized protein K437DRAFT_133270 [Tilletiaria anomala UBC 951]KDN52953.1 hypothetical protein K437DRAFT_133270 [Tilletiaria anomala UBC 951]